MKNKKDLITDILTHLKENDEARERLLKVMERSDFYLDGIFQNNHDEMGLSSENKNLLLHALSSPNGKPICGFFEKEENEMVEIINGIGGLNYPVFKKIGKKIKINHASTLFNLLTKQIERGRSFDEILIKLNKKYNEII